MDPMRIALDSVAQAPLTVDLRTYEQRKAGLWPIVADFQVIKVAGQQLTLGLAHRVVEVTMPTLKPWARLRVRRRTRHGVMADRWLIGHAGGQGAEYLAVATYTVEARHIRDLPEALLVTAHIGQMA